MESVEVDDCGSGRKEEERDCTAIYREAVLIQLEDIHLTRPAPGARWFNNKRSKSPKIADEQICHRLILPVGCTDHLP